MFAKFGNNDILSNHILCRLGKSIIFSPDKLDTDCQDINGKDKVVPVLSF